MGPSNFLALKAELSTIIPAYPLMGICQVFVFMPIIPEMIERIQYNLRIKEGDFPALDAKLND